MKVGIITQPLIDNYGGVLQNFALQRVLEELGHQPVTFDTCYRYKLWKYWLSRLHIKFLKWIEKKDYQGPVKPYKGRLRNKNIGGFVEKYIKTIDGSKGLSNNLLERYNIEALVVGSDQVWRPKYNSPKSCSTLYNSFLDFAYNIESIKKITYAASFGVDFWEYTNEETVICKRLIKQFDAISVRESSGKLLSATYLDRQDAVWVPDPTLLLEASIYRSAYSSNPMVKHINKNRLVAYLLDNNKDSEDKLRKEAKKMNMELIILSVDKYSPFEWIEAIDTANFVVTDSFHGTVFSMIMNTPVLIKPSGSRGISRFKDLFDHIGEPMDNYIISSLNDLPLPQRWNERKIERKLKNCRIIGREYLKMSLFK